MRFFEESVVPAMLLRAVLHFPLREEESKEREGGAWQEPPKTEMPKSERTQFGATEETFEQLRRE
jgi:hypothetical protein